MEALPTDTRKRTGLLTAASTKPCFSKHPYQLRILGIYKRYTTVLSGQLQLQTTFRGLRDSMGHFGATKDI